jgi:hypothetical protein
MPTVSMKRLSWTWGCLAAFALSAASGCGDGPCGGSEERTLTAADLPCSSIDANGIWESHPFPPLVDETCNWLEFRACSTYRFENPLAEAPTVVIGYTSFEQDGGFSTVGSGNSFVVEEATDSEIVIRNAQNQWFYLRLVLE